MPKIFLKSFFVIALLFGITIQLAVAQKMFFRNYTVSDGLCANTIWDIEQDEQGFMWFGTKYGLNRFDGYEFKSFQFNKNVEGSIGNNFIRKIFKYDQFTFWIGTDEGIYIFDLKTEKFKLFDPLGKIFINDIFRSNGGEIWIATKEKGIYCYYPKTKKVKHFTHNPNLKNSLSSNEVSKIIQDKLGNIWIGTYGKGIDVLDRKNNLIKRYKSSSTLGSLSNDVILDMYLDFEGQIWIGTMSGGLNVWNSKTEKFKVYQKSDKETISDNIVRSIYQPKPDLLYLATEKGLNIFDIKNNKFVSYQNKNNDPYSLSDDAVYTVFKDKEGGIWVGTYFGGLNYYHEKALGLEYYYPSGVSNSLSGNAVSAFLETKRGEFWIGTEDGGLNYFNAVDKNFKKYPFKSSQDSLSYHNIHALYEDKGGKLWIGMYTGGLNILNPVTGKIKRHKSKPSDSETLSDNSVYSIDEDREGRIWVSTISGLNLYNPKTESFIRINGKYLAKSCIYQVYQDKDLVLWIATYDNGLIRISKDGLIKQYAYSQKKGAISSNKVISILDDDEGNLWLGTDGGGLNVFNIISEKFTVYDENFGVSAEVIYGVLKGSQSNFWLSTNNGIFELNIRDNTTRNFGRWDNLQSQQYNYKAYYKSKDGKLYFGGINGFNAFYPQKVKTVTLPSKVAFTNFQLFNKDIDLLNEDSPIKQTINFTQNLILNHSQSVISLEYAALSYASPNKIQYSFKMEGFDKNWNDVGAQRKATYTNLPAGDYVFKVRETDALLKDLTKISTVNITILPPFYKSNLAYILYAILGLLIFILFRKYASKKAIKENEIKLERLKNKSEQDFYKQKIEFFTAMAHEIRTPLSLIIAPLERLLSKKEKDSESQEQLIIMEENSDRLLTLVNQLLDFRRIESDIFEIHKEQIELVSFITNLKGRFSSISYQKGIQFTIQTSLKSLKVMVDPEAIMKIMSNLLINAFKFTRKKVEIRLNGLVTINNEQMISICIEDDGIGIPKEQIDSIFTKFFKVSTEEHQYSNLGGTGIGLALAKSLIEKHQGKLLVDSQEGIKTIFTVLIPYQEKSDEIEVTSEMIEDDEIVENDGNFTVLVVEDDLSLLNFLSQSLIIDGYNPIKATNGEEALKILDKQHVDLIISDVMMPVMDGLSLCKVIKNDINYSHLPIILLTAKTNSEAEIEGLESGADAYIAKPFKWKQLSLITRNLIDLQANLKQRFAQHPFESTEILASGTKDKKFLNKLILSIEERISDPLLSVEELSKELGLSRSSLYKKVKGMTGHVPNEFIRIIRLKNAAKLLTTQDYNISEVGYMVGFSSHSYFSKCFAQQFKLTPTEFADQHKTITT
jgi:signal transduction histidine kinase/ligand-binding sensor domain-containing protein/CheY-like chemotaxis protein/predicted DNA-binding transcriptional regulator AlpA